MNMNELTEVCGPPISTYTREQAIDDGVLVDANTGDFDEISRQHYPNAAIAMTGALFELIDKAVKNPHCHNDYKGVWHDILWMGQFAVRRQGGCFVVIITGTGRVRNHVLRVAIGRMDDGSQPSLTYMLREES